MDLSESCGHNIAEQAALFDSIKPLFSRKPVLIVCNKTDIAPIEDLSDENKQILKRLSYDALMLETPGYFNF